MNDAIRAELPKKAWKHLCAKLFDGDYNRYCEYMDAHNYEHPKQLKTAKYFIFENSVIPFCEERCKSFANLSSEEETELTNELISFINKNIKYRIEKRCETIVEEIPSDTQSRKSTLYYDDIVNIEGIKIPTVYQEINGKSITGVKRSYNRKGNYKRASLEESLQRAVYNIVYRIRNSFRDSFIKNYDAYVGICEVSATEQVALWKEKLLELNPTLNPKILENLKYPRIYKKCWIKDHKN